MTENMKEILEVIPLCLSCFALGFAICNLLWTEHKFSSKKFARRKKRRSGDKDRDD